MVAVLEPFAELGRWRPTVVHVRTNTFSDRSAPFIRQTVLGLRPYFRNVVLARGSDCTNPADVAVEILERTLRDPVYCAAVIDRLNASYPSIAMVMGHLGNGSCEGYLLARALGVPFVGSFGGSDVNVELGRASTAPRYQMMLESPSAHFVTVAAYLRDRLIDRGVPGERVFVWHRGVDLEKFAPAGRGGPRDRFRIVMSARFLEVKGHRFALEAFARLRQRHPHARLSLLGDGPAMAEMKALARALGVADVEFAGLVPHREVARHLRDADVYLQPSVCDPEGRTEGVPNATMEALAIGLPVVATDHGGIPELVHDGVTGYLVPERDAEALAERLADLAADADRRIAMGERGRALIAREFNLPIQARRLATRLYQVARTAALFQRRRWPLHHRERRDRIEALSREIADAGDALTGRLLRDAAPPSLVIRPFLKFIGREVRRSFGKVVVDAANQLADGRPPAPEHEPTTLLTTSALCVDCPRMPAEQPWAHEPCPLDPVCLDTLDREFGGGQRAAGAAARRRSVRWHSLDDDELGDGALDLADASIDRLLVQASLQPVAALPALFAELRRVVKRHGELTLRIWPLPGGRDGGLLLTPPSAAPFALRFFPAQVRRIRWFDSDDLRRAARGAGFVLASEERGSPYDEPCEVAVQARFAALFRRLGCTADQLARSFVATFTAP